MYYQLALHRRNRWVLVRNVDGDSSDLAVPGDSRARSLTATLASGY